MPFWALTILKKIVAPFVVSKAIDYAKEELKDKDVDYAVEQVSQVAQTLQLIKDREDVDSPAGHIDDETKRKALQVVESAIDIADMLEVADALKRVL